MRTLLRASFSMLLFTLSCFAQQNVPCKCQEGITEITCNVCSGKGTTGKCLGNGCNAGKIKGPAKSGCKTYRYHYDGFYGSRSSTSNNKCGCSDCAVPCGACEGTGLRACLKCKRLGKIACTRANNRNHVAPNHRVDKNAEPLVNNTGGATQPTGSTGNDEIVAQLKKLKKLKDENVLTEEEYELKRRVLVDKLTASE